MPLPPRQLKLLSTMKSFRTSPPTLGWYLRAAWPGHAWQLSLGGFAVGFFAWGGWPSVSAGFAGLLIGTLSRDIRWFQRYVKAWPLSEEITDWPHVDALLDGRVEPRSPA